MKNENIDFKTIEEKWRKRWEKEKLYQARDPIGKKNGKVINDKCANKKYVLVEFPYPSGAGLHVGHARSWTAMDAYARKARMQGFNVLYPMGWDAFGLPAENYAIKTGVHPSKTVAENIAKFREQCKSLGLSFDWGREVDTTDPNYYRWTQWIFLKLYEKGLAYWADSPVNWCPSCKTILANEEVLADSAHERCGSLTERRMQKQWVLRITKYADRLLDDLKEVDYSPSIALQQINWIGKTQGVTIDYPVVGSDKMISCYSTRPDTNFGATFVVIAPEHPNLSTYVAKERCQEVEKYVSRSSKKSELERISEEKEKTGVFTGNYCLNRLTGKQMPIWVSDFVIATAGTGVVVGVPAHDKRDWDFAKKYDLEIVPVIGAKGDDPWDYEKGPFLDIDDAEVFNSDFLNGLPAIKAKEKIIDYLVEKGWGVRSSNYHLRDWIFSRQHYWGEPIPIIHCEKCGIVPVPEEDLPVELPYVEKYQPAETGESPLSGITEWVNVKCPKCGGPAKRETDTMPNWAGSNWYFVAYCFASKLANYKFKITKSKQTSNTKFQNPKKIGNWNLELGTSQNIFETSKDVLSYWLPVDIYQGGFEHTTLHLLYSRFIYKFLFDIGAVPTKEPYLKRRSHGIVLGKDGRKMSKSFGNVVNPDDIIAQFGADTLRLYEAFIGPFDQMVSWSQEGVEGCFRFLKRVWTLSLNSIDDKDDEPEVLRKLNLTIKKVGEDIEGMKFNTAVASMMEFSNLWQEKGNLSKKNVLRFLQLLAVFAPFVTEELWEKLNTDSRGGNSNPPRRWEWESIHTSEWPKVEDKYLVEEEVEIVVQVNGKMRGTIKANSEKLKSKNKIEEIVKKEEKVAKYLEGKKIVKVIYVPGRLINFVTSS